MSKFEDAEIYIKELLSVPIEFAVKDLNNQLYNDKVVPGLKLLVTGGQAIQTYFPNSPQLRTHDFDLKVIAPKQKVYTPGIRKRMVLLAKGIAKYFELVLNKHVKSLGIDLKKEIKDKFGLDLVLDENNNIFNASTNLRTDLLNIVTFRLKNNIKIRTNSIADVYVVDPAEIGHYPTFSGQEGSNKILSEEGGDYYIPFNVINGVPYAGMGYIIWDTYRMVDDSLERGLPKHPRYVEKRDAIINALNNPNAKLSCNAMKEYMLQCEQKYKSCLLNQQKFKTASSLIKYGVSEGILPADKNFIDRIRQTYDINYLCESLKRIME